MTDYQIGYCNITPHPRVTYVLNIAGVGCVYPLPENTLRNVTLNKVALHYWYQLEEYAPDLFCVAPAVTIT